MVATAAGPNGLAPLTERLLAPLARATKDAVRHLGLALEPGEAEPQADAEPAADTALPGSRSRAPTVPELRPLAGAPRSPVAEGPAPPRGPGSQPLQGLASRPATAVAMPGAQAGGPGRIDAGDAPAATAAPGDRGAALPQADAGREAPARAQAEPIEHTGHGPAAAAAFRAPTVAVVPAAVPRPEPGMPSDFDPPPGSPEPRAAEAMAQAIAPARSPVAASPSLQAMAARPVAAPADPVFAAPAQAVTDEAEAAAVLPRPAAFRAAAPGAATAAPATAGPFHAAPLAPATAAPAAAAPASEATPFPPGLRVRRAGPEGIAAPDLPEREAGLAPAPSTPALAPDDAPMADAAIPRPVSRQLRLVGSRLDRALAPVFGSASDSSLAAADGLSGEAAQGLQISNTFNVKVALGGHGALDPRQLEEALGDWLRAAAMRQGLMP